MHLCKNLWSSDCNRSNELCVIDSTGIHTLDENEVTKYARNENCTIIVLNFLKTLYQSAKSDNKTIDCCNSHNNHIDIQLEIK